MHIKQKEWASFKITLSLYAIIFLLPIIFYFVYSSFENMKNDINIIHKAAGLGGMIEHTILNPESEDNPQKIQDIDQTLQSLSIWVTQNNNSNLYIGSQTLLKDFTDVDNCWNTYKKIGKPNMNCWQSTDNMATIIAKMVYLKQNIIINKFYLSLILAMIIILLLVYMVRAYIQIQMKKHAIHDHDSNLFNKKYFCSELETSCARASRYDYPLSLLSIKIDNFKKGTKTYNKKTKEHILKIAGGLITSLTRTSDVACRYDEDIFHILLADTPEENALILESRMKEEFEKHDFGVTPELNFKFSTVHFHYKESSKDFISRIEQLQ